MVKRKEEESAKTLDELFARFEKKQASEGKRYPFKFLDPYQKEDQAIFFGREAETDILYQKFYQANLLLLYGPSGTGKTSLVQCGLMSRIPSADAYFISIRCADQPMVNFTTVLQQAAQAQEKDILWLLQTIYDQQHKPIVLLFDQLEEIFILSSYSERNKFIEQLQSILKYTLPVKIIFIIREEYLANLSEFEEIIPNVFDNRVRIEKMHRRHSIEVIEKSCATGEIFLEAGVADMIIDQTTIKGEIELAYLQVYLDKLYKNVKSENQQIRFTRAALATVGEMGDVLEAFLEEQIAHTPEPEKYRALLKVMISPQGTKNNLNLSEIRHALLSMGYELSTEDIRTMVKFFVDVRILREWDSGQRFELRHDALAGKIKEWLSVQEKEYLEIQISMQQRAIEYQSKGFLLDDKFLQMIRPFETKLLLNQNFKELIEKSQSEIARKKRRRRKISIVIITGFIIVLCAFLIWNMWERNIAQRASSEASRNLALALKEKAIMAAKDKNWQYMKLYTVHSLYYQNKAKVHYEMDNIELPIDDEDWILSATIQHLKGSDINCFAFSHDDKIYYLWPRRWHYFRIQC